MKAILLIAVGLLVLAAAVVDLDRVPPLFWDEGWTLSVARNWVERGHYGLLVDGRPRGPGLAAAFPVVAPIALSFRVLGVGIWQGRVPGLVLTFGTLALMGILVGSLYGPRVAWVTLAVLLLLVYPDPITVGRQALGEMPALFYLTGGYVLLGLGLRRSLWLLLPAGLAWGVALVTKAQVWPFWLASLALPLAVALAKGWRRPAAGLALGLAGGWVAERLIGRLYLVVLPRAVAEPPLAGLYDVTAAVLTPSARLAAAGLVLTYGLPALLGLVYGAWKMVGGLREPVGSPARAVLETALLILAGSWLAWFVFLAPAWVRYLFPPLFLGAPFAARLLHALGGGLEGVGTLRPSVSGLRAVEAGRAPPRVAGLVLALALVLAGALRTTAEHVFAHRDAAGRAVAAAAAFLNERTPPDALVETYDAELMFLLRRRYHYPPDQVHVELNRRTFVDASTRIGYDALAADPDYLVVGPLSALWRLYDPVLARGAFRPIERFGDYAVYERVRS